MLRDFVMKSRESLLVCVCVLDECLTILLSLLWLFWLPSTRTTQHWLLGGVCVCVPWGLSRDGGRRWFPERSFEKCFLCRFLFAWGGGGLWVVSFKPFFVRRVPPGPWVFSPKRSCLLCLFCFVLFWEGVPLNHCFSVSFFFFFGGGGRVGLGGVGGGSRKPRGAHFLGFPNSP